MLPAAAPDKDENSKDLSSQFFVFKVFSFSLYLLFLVFLP